MRNDMESLNCGKACAQAAHAASMFHEYMKSCENKIHNEMFDEWMDDRTFGTTIVLSANNDQIIEVKGNSNSYDCLCDTVWDPTYPFFVNKEMKDILPLEIANFVAEISDNKFLMTRDELTCMYVFGDKNKIQSLVSHLKLYP